MTYILNGEVLPDDDPRVIARRQQSQSSSTTATRRSGGVGNVQGIHASTGSESARQQSAGGESPDGALAPLSRALGIEGRQFAFPVQLTNLLGMQGEQRVPMIQAVLGGLLLFYLLFLRS